MIPQVKICGLTNSEDARWAVQCGADLLGFVFCEQSPRYLAPAAAAKIIAGLPAEIGKVGLFVNAPAEAVHRTAGECGLTVLQFHGDETPEYCAQFGLPVMKAFRVRGVETIEQMRQFATRYWLLDAFVEGKPGGTGHTFSWDFAVLARDLGTPFFLAGGLTPDNVAQAVRQVRPFGVDVSSGVEVSRGKKDPAKVQAFIRAAKA